MTTVMGNTRAVGHKLRHRAFNYLYLVACIQTFTCSSKNAHVSIPALNLHGCSELFETRHSHRGVCLKLPQPSVNLSNLGGPDASLV